MNLFSSLIITRKHIHRSTNWIGLVVNLTACFCLARKFLHAIILLQQDFSTNCFCFSHHYKALARPSEQRTFSVCGLISANVGFGFLYEPTTDATFCYTCTYYLSPNKPSEYWYTIPLLHLCLVMFRSSVKGFIPCCCSAR